MAEERGRENEKGERDKKERMKRSAYQDQKKKKKIFSTMVLLVQLLWIPDGSDESDAVEI